MTVSSSEFSTIKASVFQMNRDQLNELARAMKIQRQEMANDALDGLRVGDTVQFDAGPRKGGVRTGEVTKIKRKNVEVRDLDAPQRWNVSGTLLERVED